MGTKLIIIEGIPGSGKTTTAQFICDWLGKNGMTPLLYLENAHYHPVDIDNLSVFSTYQYQQLLAKFDTYRPYLTEIAESGLNGYFLHYLRWFDMYDVEFPKDLLDALMLHDAHDTLPPDRYLDILLERWASFAVHSLNQVEITIFECCLFQNPITVFMGKYNYPVADVKAIVYKLVKLVQDLHPVVIQLRDDSVRNTLQRVIATRPRQWIDLVIDYVTHQAYGKAQKLEGLEGVFAFYEVMQALEDEFVTQLAWDKLIIDIADQDWERYHVQIGDFLDRSA